MVQPKVYYIAEVNPCYPGGRRYVNITTDLDCLSADCAEVAQVYGRNKEEALFYWRQDNPQAPKRVVANC